ncbi:hypothetical protein NV379_23290 [Paenibacillus sp. N1-5-1-14]|uniref:hypothetical protein n=1 Tax=Paenibacillus radicibacter TaxID=2972488 RepID=UPI002158E024|nr:hypothetical protein [Paenibacillus radicibacter]MCR8645567.1 hypothetical protein [Paenibacillus radicibacter]
MATVTASIKLMSGMDGSLKSIARGMNFLVNAMDKLQSSFEKSVRVDERLVASNNRLIASQNNLRDSMRKVAEPPKQSSKSSDEGAKGKNPIWGTLKSIMDEKKNSDKIQKFASEAFKGAMEQIAVEDTFKGQTKDPAVGSAMFEKFKSEAISSGADVKEYLQSTLSFFPKTQNTDQLSKLNGFATRLAAFDGSGGGVKGGAKVINDAMSGDAAGLTGKFNMSKKDIDSSKIESLGKSGDIDGFIKAFDELLEKQKMSEKAAQTMLASPVKQAEMLGNNLKSALDNVGMDAAQGLAPLLSKLNEDFQAGKFQAFFDGLNQGLSLFASILVDIYKDVTYISNFISNNWTIIGPIIWGLTTAVAIFTAALAIKTTVLWALAGAWMTLNTIMKANIFILIISVIIGLIVWFYKLWETNDNFAAGLMRGWNAIMNFFDGIPAWFWVMYEALLQSLLDWASNYSKIFENVINFIISGLNKIMSLINKLTGTSFSIETTFDFDDFSTQALNYAKGKKEEEYARVAANKAQREQEVQDMYSSRANKRAAEEAAKAQKDADANSLMDKWNAKQVPSIAPTTVPNIGRVDEVGKIEDSVDVSSEDLKLMRELADIQSIQNFVSLTPTVSMTTGNINNGYDVDTIISRITKSLEEEVASSAQGVFS